MPSALRPDLPVSDEDSGAVRGSLLVPSPAERARCGGFADGGGERLRGFAVPPSAAPEEGASNAKNAENLPLEVDFSGSDLPTVDAVYAAVRSLDHSYVAVQGPPGGGKTFLASHVIARLVAEGAKVGVVAQSHAVIENLMSACCARDGFDVSRAVRLRGKSVTPDARGLRCLILSWWS